eukprot:gnl/Trimastix_PCT/274.p2 GENE.gnl/Trimastix_PCT/274~~gnl/Trimastix_PCT/274.p2  ORF type:complete len:173 (+),score=49.88 gnl/Trimastix_PCT/274:44-520(+)
MRTVLLFLCLFALGAFALSDSPAQLARSEDDLELVPSLPFEEQPDLKCSCEGHHCSCCQHIKIKTLVKINTHLCANITYIPDQVAIDISVDADGHVLWHNKMKLLDPSPICFKMWVADACIQLYDVSVSEKRVKGCIKGLVKFIGIEILHFKMGCFSF